MYRLILSLCVSSFGLMGQGPGFVSDLHEYMISSGNFIPIFNTPFAWALCLFSSQGGREFLRKAI